jgi:hypothetical protein
MRFFYPLERNLLRIAIALGGVVPVAAGFAGVLGAVGIAAPAGDIVADSHLRYLSGLLLAIGLAFWASIPRVERHTERFQLLTALVLIGGIARLAAALATGATARGIWLALVMELVVTPALCLWQRRIAAGAAGAPAP